MLTEKSPTMTPLERQRSVLLTKAAPPPATPAPTPTKAAATKTGHLVDHLAAENSRLRKDLAEKRTEVEAPQRDPLAFQLGDGLARVVRGMKFRKTQTPVTFS